MSNHDSDEDVPLKDIAEKQKNPDGPEKEMEKNDKIFKRLKIKNFSPKEQNIVNWFKYFDMQCSIYNLNANWKLKNVPTFLEGEAFDYAIQMLENNTTYETLKQDLILRFEPIEENLLEKFNKMNLRENDDIQDFYFKKVNLAKKIKLPENLIIESLVNSTPKEFQNVIRICSLETPADWLKKMKRLVGSEDHAETQRSSKYIPAQGLETKTGERNMNLGFRKGCNDPYLRWRNREGREERAYDQNFPPKRSHFSTWNKNFTEQKQVENNRNFPKYPCTICASKGIINSMHYIKECIFYKESEEDKQTEDK